MESTKTIVVRKQPDAFAIIIMLVISIFCVVLSVFAWDDTIDIFIVVLFLAIVIVPTSMNALCWQFFGKETFVFSKDTVEVIKSYLFFSNKQTMNYYQIYSIDLQKNRHNYASSFYGIKVLFQALFHLGGTIDLHLKDGSVITCCQGDQNSAINIVNEFNLRCSTNGLQKTLPSKISYSSYRKINIAKKS